MGFAVLICVLVVIAFICACIGISMMPLHHRTFSSMSREERVQYRKGLVIMVAPLLCILLFMLLFVL